MLVKLGLWPKSSAAIAHRIAKPYSFMHAGRINNAAGLRKAAAHLLREMPVPNADPALVGTNRIVEGSRTVRSVINDYDRITAERAADGLTDNGEPTIAVHYVATIPSREWYAAANDATRKGLMAAMEESARRLFGARNVLVIVWHFDEETPHLHALVLPYERKRETRGRKPKDASRAKPKAMKWFRNATAWFGDRDTAKAVLSRRQDEYHAMVAPFGMLRGKSAAVTQAKQIKGSLRTSKLREAAAELETGHRLLAADRLQLERSKDEWSRGIADDRARMMVEAEAEAQATTAAAVVEAERIRKAAEIQAEEAARRLADLRLAEVNRAFGAALDDMNREAKALFNDLGRSNNELRRAARDVALGLAPIVRFYEQMGGVTGRDAVASIMRFQEALDPIAARPNQPAQISRLRQIRAQGVKVAKPSAAALSAHELAAAAKAARESQWERERSPS